MTIASTSVRVALDAIRFGGKALARLGLWPPTLDEERLLADACRRTGLDDFGGEAFRDPLQLLCRSLTSEARLTPLGWLVARGDLLSLLVNRLRVVEDRKRNPGIVAQEIRRPLFITGLPRTGTTLLHNLLGRDPSNRVAQTWEVMAPSPPPERARYQNDPRIAAAARQLRWFHVLAPEFRKVHPVGAQLPLECIAITSHTFLSPRFHSTYQVPTYRDWLEGQDLRPAYEFHREFLQHLQWRNPAERWVLKAPTHLFWYDALFRTYPDAMIVQTHRDPVTVMASVASLTAVLQSAFAEGLDFAEIGSDVTRRWANELERASRVRRGGRGGDERFVDVHYAELARDPVGTVRRIYARFDLRWTREAESRMRRYLADNPKDKHGPHQYSLETFGLDATDLSHRFKAYRDFFGVEPEPAPAV